MNVALEIRPVMDTLQRHNRKILEIRLNCDGLNPKEEHEVVKHSYGFLADALIKTDPYPLRVEHWFGFWPLVMSFFPDTKFADRYHRAAIATIIAGTHAVEGLRGSDWEQMPRYYLETSQLPVGVLNDHPGLRYVTDRLEAVRFSAVEIGQTQVSVFQIGLHKDILDRAIGNGMCNLLRETSYCLKQISKK